MKSNALQRYERSCEEQVFKVGECLGVPNKMNSSKDNFDAESSVGATMVETTNPVCDLSVMFPMRFWLVLTRVFLLTKNAVCLTETLTAL